MFQKVLSLTAAAALTMGAVVASADEYPSKPIHLVVAYAPGGTTDTIARIIAGKLSEQIGQPVVVENRPGGTGQIGSRYVASSAPDGYTLQIATQTTHAVAPSLYKSIPYDPLKDFTPITLAVFSPLVLIAHPSLPVNDVAGLISYVKERPGQISYATGGTGDGSHMAALFFNNLTGIDSVAIPHQGEGPAIPQVVGGHLPYMFCSIPTAAPFVESGQVKALGVTGSTRSPKLPEVPTIAEAGVKGYEMGTWWGIFGPAGMPDAVVEKLNTEIVKVLKDPATQTKITGLGYEVRGSTAKELGDFLVAENQRWAKVIKEQGYKAN